MEAVVEQSTTERNRKPAYVKVEAAYTSLQATCLVRLLQGILY
ncbi:hypothetical protein FTV88_0811 [Heliorestis convoluta]|uniref:Uncharacterized protein n=1 Tax=Heliorestis convoluta TaxID=356322 RepID=A0A5Q2MYE7_9FIRM|nr:hypothetical protein FTV88_0811 [Heliorestis convoluta]